MYNRVKRQIAFEHVQIVLIHIILSMRKVSSRPLLSTDDSLVPNDSGSG